MEKWTICRQHATSCSNTSCIDWTLFIVSREETYAYLCNRSIDSQHVINYHVLRHRRHRHQLRRCQTNRSPQGPLTSSLEMLLATAFDDSTWNISIHKANMWNREHYNHGWVPNPIWNSNSHNSLIMSQKNHLIFADEQRNFNVISNPSPFRSVFLYTVYLMLVSFYILRQLQCVRQSLDMNSRKMFIHALVTWHIWTKCSLLIWLDLCLVNPSKHSQQTTFSIQ